MRTIRALLVAVGASILLASGLSAQQSTPKAVVNLPPGAGATRAAKQLPRKKGADADKERLLEAVRRTARKADASRSAPKK